MDVFQVNDSSDGNTSDFNSSLSSAVLNFLVNEVMAIITHMIHA